MSPRRLRSLSLAAALTLAGLLGHLSVTPARAAILEQDLGQGLAYLRTNDLRTDFAAVEKKLSARLAVVLDLRHAAASDDTAAALLKLLSQPPASSRYVRLILISEATAPALLKHLAAHQPGIVILAAKSDNLVPDIAVATPTDEDRQAYDALGRGAALDRLLSGTTPQKKRYDEASLVRDHANGTSPRAQFADEPDDELSGSEGAAANADAEKPANAPVDRVLLRAVQLHRTLLALKKL